MELQKNRPNETDLDQSQGGGVTRRRFVLGIVAAAAGAVMARLLPPMPGVQLFPSAPVAHAACNTSCVLNECAICVGYTCSCYGGSPCNSDCQNCDRYRALTEQWTRVNKLDGPSGCVCHSTCGAGDVYLIFCEDPQCPC